MENEIFDLDTIHIIENTLLPYLGMSREATYGLN